MTWSIVARDPRNGHFGIVIASRFFAVGALCPHVAGRAGALSTQALVNPLYGRAGIELLEGGASAGDAIAALVAADPGREHRQVHAVDASGGVGAHTGSGCVAWCGHRSAHGVSVAGNMLAGAQVLDATLDAFHALGDLPLGLRLLRALKAGEDAGGDSRGKQSAALRLHAGQPYPALDIRADDHAEPIDELMRLYEVAHERFLPFSQAFAPALGQAGIIDRAEIDRRIAAWLAERERDGRPGRI